MQFPIEICTDVFHGHGMRYNITVSQLLFRNSRQITGFAAVVWEGLISVFE